MTARVFFYTPVGSLRTVWRWAGFLLIAATAYVALQLAVLLVHVPRGMVQAQAMGFVVLLAAVTVAHWVMLRWVDRKPWSWVWLGQRQARPRLLLWGFAAGAVAIGVPSVLLLAGRWLSVAPAPDGSWVAFAAALLAFFLPQSLAEEMLMRGYLFASAREGMGWRGALALTSVIFGALHLANPGADARSFVLVVMAGVFLGGIVLLTDSLWAAWMAHCAWNWTMAALLHAPVSGLPLPVPDYRMVDTGPDWATGGSWGPEGGAGAALGMVLVVGGLVWWRRRKGIGNRE